MLILHAAQTYAPQVGGVSEVVRQISERLARRGHEVHVATSAFPGCPAQEMIHGVVVHRFAVRGNDFTGIAGESDAYIHFVRSKKWDVLTFHCVQTWSTDLLLNQSFPTNGIFVAHGISPHHDSIYSAYYARLAEWIRRGMIVVSLSSDGVEDHDFIRKYGLSKSVIIPNGVDILEWSGPTLNMRRELGMVNRPWLVNVSNHNPAKGHERLFELLSALTPANRNVRLTQIGRSFPAARYNLGHLGIQGGCWYKCKSKAYFQPMIQMKSTMLRKEVISAVREADVMVLTSNQEASPLVVLESMAAGTPFVTFDVGCVREHVGGVVVSSIEEMAEAVTRLLGDSEMRKSLGAEGLNRVKERHDWEVITSQYEALYRRTQEVGAQYVNERN